MITRINLLRTWIVARTANTERGANLVEYILLVAFIALIVVAAVVILQGQISNEFEDAKDCLDNAGGAVSC